MSMSSPKRNRHSAAEQARASGKRGWRTSIAVAVVIVSAGVLLSAVVNPLFGRAIHWDWMAGLVPVLLVAFALSLRNRWV